MYLLGISGQAACLVRDGAVVAAAEEARFTLSGSGEHTQLTAHELPFHAVDGCLREAGITLSDLAHVAYVSDHGLMAGQPYEAAPMLERAVGETPALWSEQQPFRAAVVDTPRRLETTAPRHIRLKGVGRASSFRWHFVARHLAHAAGAFLPSPFEYAAVLTLGEQGEHVATGYALGDGARVEPLAEVRAPHSLGALCGQVAAHLGFPGEAGTQAVAALAPFGRPRYRETLRQIVRVEGEGRYSVAPPCLEQRFGPARAPGEPLAQRHCDLACSLQATLEETVLTLATWLHETTGAEDLCLGGEVADNSALITRLRDEGPFRRVWVQPAAGSAGAALGAALLLETQERGERGAYTMSHTFLGPAYRDDEIEALLHLAGLPYRRADDIAAATAELLAEGKVVGWFQGRIERGSHAIGARAVLASPAHATTRKRMNELTGREGFIPVAALVLEEEADAWFVGADESPFGLFDYDARPASAGRIAAVCHVDGTTRVQTIRREQHERAYDVVRAFARLTDVPLLAAAPFHAPGKPAVCAPRDAIEAVRTMGLDALAIGPFLVEG